ncbi:MULTISPECIES: biotin-dependent carboxyltransferase family protein [Paenibacillus]|uniref:KipI antagonist n=1 Tax=Paenibacillus albilobatus TaxID=2716884 RepID=A0A919XET8_9BACL|nr:MULTISPECIES: biotin-dependent carboxyltransferase family protein [Paenibacillus]GIO29300.1 KipI antagonist [Paenibacillus albilobatus]
MSIEVIKRGLLVTVQDLGRTGFGKFGIGKSGAMDKTALRIANWLVGNDGGEAALEVTWSGFSVRFHQNMLVSITGADLSPESGGKPVPMWRPVWFRQGSELTFRRPVSGCRAYLAASGGWDVPEVLGSRSTYLRAGIGGVEGRALQSGDMIHSRRSDRSGSNDDRFPGNGGDEAFRTVRWSAAPRQGYIRPNHLIRVTKGRQYGDFRAEDLCGFFEGSYRVKPESDRMGYRLSGPRLTLRTAREYLSEGVTDGTVQVPPDGQPIILMADRQTLGGYPKIAQVISADLPKIAQLSPGNAIRFREVSLAEAEAAYLAQERGLQLLRKRIGDELKEVVECCGWT